MMDELNINTEDLKVENIDVSQILANRYQPRTIFEELELEELAASIANHGLLQPIILRKVTSDMFEIVAGERRYRASKLAGLQQVPAIVKDITAQDAAILALIENIQREDLTAVEEAKSYEQLINLFNKTQNEIADMVGKSQSAVANKLRLLQLTEEVKRAIERKLISERHGRALLKVKDTTEQNKILELTLERELTVAALEEYIERYLMEIEKVDDEEKGATVFNIAKDTKLAVNTINQAVKTIKNFGMDVTIEQVEHEDEYLFEISIPKNLVEVEKKKPSFAHEAKKYEASTVEKPLAPEEEILATVTTKQEATPEEDLETSKSMILDLDLTTENVFDFSGENAWSDDDLKKIINNSEN